MQKNIYIIDTSSLIELNRYPRVSFPGLWQDLEKLVKSGRLISTREVLEEVNRYDDEIANWCRRNKALFLDNPEIQKKAHEIAQQFPKLIDPSKPIDADPFVIATALVARTRERSTLVKRNVIVVTEEVEKGGKTNIPSVCKSLNIEYINFLGLISLEKWKYIRIPKAT